MKIRLDNSMKYGFTYLWLCLRFVIVTAVLLLIFYTNLILKIDTEDIIGRLLELIREEPLQSVELVFLDLFRFVLFVLVWWRVCKVVVFLGSPFLCGMSMGTLKETYSGKSTRPITRITIGKYKTGPVKSDSDKMEEIEKEVKSVVAFWYGAFFKSHESSDKLIRSRLLYVVIACPIAFNWAIIVNQSRFKIRKLGHKGRAKTFF